MSAKQAGVSLLKSMAISAQTLRNALKPEFRAAAESRGVTDVKVIKIVDGKQSEPKELKPIDL